jgi:hypothetical protein
MLWDAKVCRVDDFESDFVRGPSHVAQSLQILLDVALCCMTKPLTISKRNARGRFTANAEMMWLMISPRPLASRIPCPTPIVENGWQGRPAT